MKGKGRSQAPKGPHAYSVALVGRPNVGKSALFNRLSGTRKALVHDRPGMTRDSFSLDLVSESGRRWRLVDTGGLDLDAAGGFAAWTSEKALDAVVDADLIVLVLDGSDGVLPEDQRIAGRLRALGKPVVVAWNKIDRKEAEQGLEQGYELGWGDVFGVSAVHGIGTDELLEELEKRLPEDLDPETRVEGLPVAIVGRPNVGKSSIVNRILGADRVMVSEIAGTTRNPVDVLVTRAGKSYVLVDTAGIRRKGKTTDSAELLSVVAARKAMERARVAIIIFDASEGITAQDAHIAGYAEEARRGLVLVANKWDLLEGDESAQNALRDDVRRRFIFTRGAAFLTVSAKTGLGIDELLPEADGVARRLATKFSTGELNRVLQRAFEAQLPKGKSGHEMKIRYAVQVASEPPLIRLFSDRDEPLHFSFERFLQNRLRENWDLAGVPLKFIIRKSDEGPARPAGRPTRKRSR